MYALYFAWSIISMWTDSARSWHALHSIHSDIPTVDKVVLFEE